MCKPNRNYTGVRQFLLKRCEAHHHSDRHLKVLIYQSGNCAEGRPRVITSISFSNLTKGEIERLLRIQFSLGNKNSNYKGPLKCVAVKNCLWMLNAQLDLWLPDGFSVTPCNQICVSLLSLIEFYISSYENGRKIRSERSERVGCKQVLCSNVLTVSIMRVNWGNGLVIVFIGINFIFNRTSDFLQLFFLSSLCLWFI